MYKFNWNGNNGYCYPEPGQVAQAECGICGTRMNVERNVLGPTGFAENLAGGKHLHDRFLCPNLAASWHDEIVIIKMAAVDYSLSVRNVMVRGVVREDTEEKARVILEKAETQS